MLYKSFVFEIYNITSIYRLFIRYCVFVTDILHTLSVLAAIYFGRFCWNSVWLSQLSFYIVHSEPIKFLYGPSRANNFLYDLGWSLAEHVPFMSGRAGPITRCTCLVGHGLNFQTLYRDGQINFLYWSDRGFPWNSGLCRSLTDILKKFNISTPTAHQRKWPWQQWHFKLMWIAGRVF